MATIKTTFDQATSTNVICDRVTCAQLACAQAVPMLATFDHAACCQVAFDRVTNPRPTFDRAACHHATLNHAAYCYQATSVQVVGNSPANQLATSASAMTPVTASPSAKQVKATTIEVVRLTGQTVSSPAAMRVLPRVELAHK